jgi:site-specific DNA-methyltransferase (adenine-specific)
LQKNGYKEHLNKDWDKNIPSSDYFGELFRISKNQIIWGANYFAKYLPSTMCWIFWYKMQDNFSFSDGEFAFTSFQKKARIFKYARGNESGFAPKGNTGANIHPTQKPVGLYKWLLHNYATIGDKIIDAHLGSGSSAIAAHNMGFSFVGCKIDRDYFDAACKRFKEQTAQLSMF